MIYFASDIHLGAGDPQSARAVERRFVAWLDFVGRDAEAVFLLGDVFDFWFEYRGVVPRGFVRTLGKLAELTDRGVRVVFFPGNHDLWVGDYLTRECGIEIHTAPEVMTLAGQRIFMAHGDNLNVRGDWKLQLLNRMFRSRLLRKCFAWGLHPDLAMRFGRWWSGSSRKRHNVAAQRQGGAADFCAHLTEPLIDYARAYARTHSVDHFVFGHMHFARDYRQEDLHTVHLGCWEQTPTYAVLDPEGRLRLETFDCSHLFSPRPAKSGVLRDRAVRSEPGSALGLSKTFKFLHVFSPRHSSCEPGSALGLSKTFKFLHVFSPRPAKSGVLRDRAVRSEPVSALGSSKTFKFLHVFSPRHSSSKLVSALGLSKTFGS